MTVSRPRKRTRAQLSYWQAVGRLGRLGALLSGILTLVTLGGLLLLAPLAADWLAQAQVQLTNLNTQLASVKGLLEPLDLLGRPETLSTVRSLGTLAQQVRESPLAGLVLGQSGVTEQALTEFQALAGNWETMLETRPTLPELQARQDEVQLWLTRVQTAQRWLTPLTWVLGALTLLTGAMSLAGQLALSRLADWHVRDLQAQAAAEGAEQRAQS